MANLIGFRKVTVLSGGHVTPRENSFIGGICGWWAVGSLLSYRTQGMCGNQRMEKSGLKWLQKHRGYTGDLSAAMVFENKLWMMGGRKLPGSNCSNQVWRSINGSEWKLVTDNATWSPRLAPALLFSRIECRYWEAPLISIIVMTRSGRMMYGHQLMVKRGNWEWKSTLFWKSFWKYWCRKIMERTHDLS